MLSRGPQPVISTGPCTPTCCDSSTAAPGSSARKLSSLDCSERPFCSAGCPAAAGPPAGLRRQPLSGALAPCAPVRDAAAAAAAASSGTAASDSTPRTAAELPGRLRPAALLGRLPAGVPGWRRRSLHEAGEDWECCAAGQQRAQPSHLALCSARLPACLPVRMPLGGQRPLTLLIRAHRNGQPSGILLPLRFQAGQRALHAGQAAAALAVAAAGRGPGVSRGIVRAQPVCAWGPQQWCPTLCRAGRAPATDARHFLPTLPPPRPDPPTQW